MIPTTIAPISGHHHRSGSYSQPQEHQGAAQNDHHHPNHQQPLDGPYPHFDTRGRPVPGVCFFLLLSFLIDRALILLLFLKKGYSTCQEQTYGRWVLHLWWYWRIKRRKETRSWIPQISFLSWRPIDGRPSFVYFGARYQDFLDRA